MGGEETYEGEGSEKKKRCLLHGGAGWRSFEKIACGVRAAELESPPSTFAAAT